MQTIDPILQAAECVGDDLKKKHLHITTAESCTGGGIAEALTRVPGSSQWFGYGFVTYSAEAKHQLLGVPLELIRSHGIVSEAVTVSMAIGALHRSGAEVSVAVNGIAGPDGGTEENPVGTVWIAWGKVKQKTQVKKFHFVGDRLAVREQAVLTALRFIVI